MLHTCSSQSEYYKYAKAACEQYLYTIALHMLTLTWRLLGLIYTCIGLIHLMHIYFVIKNCDKMMHFCFNFDACPMPLHIRVHIFGASKSQRACIILSQFRTCQPTEVKMCTVAGHWFKTMCMYITKEQKNL